MIKCRWDFCWLLYWTGWATDYFKDLSLQVFKFPQSLTAWAWVCMNNTWHRDVSNTDVTSCEHDTRFHQYDLQSMFENAALQFCFRPSHLRSSRPPPHTVLTLSFLLLSSSSGPHPNTSHSVPHLLLTRYCFLSFIPLPTYLHQIPARLPFLLRLHIALQCNASFLYFCLSHNLPSFQSLSSLPYPTDTDCIWFHWDHLLQSSSAFILRGQHSIHCQ